MSVGLNVSEEEAQDGKIILRVEGRLDANTSSQLENHMNQVLQKEKTKILLDFTRVDYLSSAGMRLLLSATKKIKAGGGNLILSSINDDVMEIIRMAGFEKILQIFSSESEALAAL